MFQQKLIHTSRDLNTGHDIRPNNFDLFLLVEQWFLEQIFVFLVGNVNKNLYPKLAKRRAVTFDFD